MNIKLTLQEQQNNTVQTTVQRINEHVKLDTLQQGFVGVALHQLYESAYQQGYLEGHYVNEQRDKSDVSSDEANISAQ